MKLFGSLTELVSIVFRQNTQAITGRPNQATTYTASRDIQLPPGDTDHVLVSATSTQTLSNKTLANSSNISVKDTNFVIQDDGDTSKQIKFEASVLTTGNTVVLSVPTASTTLVGTDSSQSLTNKTLNNTNVITVKDANFAMQDDTDTTKQLQFQLSGITTSTTRTLTIPDASDTIVVLAASQILTNKTLTAPVMSSFADMTEIATPATPGAGILRLYSKSGDGLYIKNSSGTESQIATTASTVDLTSVQTLQNKTLDNTNTVTLKDTLFTLQDDGDTSKQLRFQLSGISTSTTRTITVPNASDTLAVLGTAQTFSAEQTFSAQVRISDGTVSEPSIVFTSDDDTSGTGIYRVGANSLGFSANGVNIGQYSSAGAWTIGNSTSTQTQTIFGTNINFTNNDSSSAGLAAINLNNDATKSANFEIFGSAAVGTTLGVSSANNAFLRAPGTTSLTIGTAGSTSLTMSTNDTIAGSIDSSQKWTVGASGGTQVHVVNGTLSASVGIRVGGGTDTLSNYIVGSTATTFTFNGTGGTTSSITLRHVRVGDWVTLHFPSSALANTGTSTDRMTSNTAVGSSFRPATTTQSYLVPAIKNNGAGVTTPGYLEINTSGNISIFRDSTGTLFTNSAQAGPSTAFSITYYVGTGS